MEMVDSTLKSIDRKHIWHPFDQMKGADIIPIVKGEGAVLYAEDGTRYVDGVSSWWVNTHGHCNPYIAKTVAEQAMQLEHVAFAGLTHPQAVNLSERLLKLLPSKIEKCFFSDNGSTATEIALKMAIQYWYNQGTPKTKFIALEGSYHGDTFGSMSLSARGSFNEPFESFLIDVEFLPLPTKENRVEVLQRMDAILESSDVAGFIFEPIVQGARGMVMHDPNVLSECIQKCLDKDVITIADEVMTGFGRTGKMFAIDHIDAKPDIVCMSKGITGGFMPLSITAISDRIYQAFYSDDRKKSFLHGHSYTGNALACSAANANLDLFETEEVKDQISSLCEKQAAYVSKMKGHKALKEARCFGTIAALEIDAGASGYFNNSGKEAYNHLLTKGIILRPLGNVIVILPPFCIQEEDLNLIYNEVKLYLDGLV